MPYETLYTMMYNSSGEKRVRRLLLSVTSTRAGSTRFGANGLSLVEVPSVPL